MGDRYDYRPADIFLLLGGTNGKISLPKSAKIKETGKTTAQTTKKAFWAVVPESNQASKTRDTLRHMQKKRGASAAKASCLSARNTANIQHGPEHAPGHKFQYFTNSGCQAIHPWHIPYTSFRPIKTPMEDAIMRPLVQPEESPKQ